MYFQIDLDPTHSVIRLTILEEMMSLECAEECYRQLKVLTSTGGPHAAIYDLSIVKGTTIPTDVVRGLARRKPSIPTGTGRPIVVVGIFPVVYGLARLFQMCGESVGNEFDVAHTMQEAYAMVEVRPEDFTDRLYPPTSGSLNSRLCG